MKKYIAPVLLATAAATLVVLPSADAAPAEVTSTCGTCVAPITCTVEDQCVLDFVGNGGKGYWRARQWNGTVWVRLTMVNGQ